LDLKQVVLSCFKI